MATANGRWVGHGLGDSDDPTLPEGMDERALGKFLGKHYHELVEAYAARDLAVMEEVVLACEAQDAEDEKEAE